MEWGVPLSKTKKRERCHLVASGGKTSFNLGRSKPQPATLAARRSNPGSVFPPADAAQKWTSLPTAPARLTHAGAHAGTTLAPRPRHARAARGTAGNGAERGTRRPLMRELPVMLLMMMMMMMSGGGGGSRAAAAAKGASCCCCLLCSCIAIPLAVQNRLEQLRTLNNCTPDS